MEIIHIAAIMTVHLSFYLSVLLRNLQIICYGSNIETALPTRVNTFYTSTMLKKIIMTEPELATGQQCFKNSIINNRVQV